MKMIVDGYMPERAHEGDAGIDMRASASAVIQPHSSAVIGTSVHVEIPEGYAGVLFSKSGLNFKHDLTSTGVIDHGYQGEVMVKLYNHGDEAYHVHAGDKISQLLVIPVKYEPIELVSSFNTQTERGSNGFGSTGK